MILKIIYLIYTILISIVVGVFISFIIFKKKKSNNSNK